MYQFLFGGGIETTLSITNAIITICVSVVLGLIIALTYMKTFREVIYSQGTVLTMVIVPAVIATIILLVGSNIARAFSLAGAFTIVRFRSQISDPKDLAYVFFAMGAGLACGVGFIGYGIIFTLVLCLIMFLLSAINFGMPKNTAKILKITMPENVDFDHIYDDIFEKYTTRFKPIKTRTADLGSVYEVIYDVRLKKDISEKEFIDEIRCRNSNLTIILTANIPEMQKK